jgi:DNA invertase Pin-like site-specific DNA recombinase
MRNQLSARHLDRRAYVYVRQSTAMQVHEHVESKQRQYALVDRAVALGWERGDVEVIDEDQGKSGATSEGRVGFARLAHAVGHGEAGAVLALEVSRLARSSIDWQRLLSLCAVADVAVIDEQAIYDPSDRDDRLLLDLKGTMSEAELHWLRLRLVGGRLNKARRGELWRHAPSGYVWRDRLVLDPDEAVQAAVRTVFERFAIEPTIGAVVRWANATGFKIPTRRTSDEAAEIDWRPLTSGRVAGLLHNPTYAGVYTYGRKPTRKALVDGEIRNRLVRLPVEEWPVRIEAQHAAYISWEVFLHNQTRLAKNHSKMNGATYAAPKNGPALLAGIVVCGRCGRRMRVDYSTSDRRQWRYLCPGDKLVGRGTCWSVLGEQLDAEVESLFLATMVPSEIELSLAVDREADDQAKSLATQWQTRLEQARYQARRAERRYKAVDPDNRVVARTLEREWEACLQEVGDVERRYAEARRERRVELSEGDREIIRAIARDLPSVWRSRTTTPADRKAMLQLVIEVVAIEPIDLPERQTRLRIQWRSGIVDERFVDRPGYSAPRRSPGERAPNATPPIVIERIRTLIDEGHHDEDVANLFNREGLLTAKNKTWSPQSVASLRQAHGITKRPRPYSFLPDRHPITNKYSVPGAARLFGVRPRVIHKWIGRGLIPATHEQYGRYNACWLEIDDVLAARLRRLADRSSQERQ